MSVSVHPPPSAAESRPETPSYSRDRQQDQTGPSIFICYRREDTQGPADRLYDRLVAHLGKQRVFIDIKDIPGGDDFESVLQQTLSRTRVVLVLIGSQWLNACDEQGHRRLDDPDDELRREIETALARPDVRVIPVLVYGARMPEAQQLPDSLAPLHRRQSLELNRTFFEESVDRIVERLFPTPVPPIPVPPPPIPSVLFRVVGIGACALVTASVFMPGETGPDTYTFWAMSDQSVWHMVPFSAQLLLIIAAASVLLCFFARWTRFLWATAAAVVFVVIWDYAQFVANHTRGYSADFAWIFMIVGAAGLVLAAALAEIERRGELVSNRGEQRESER